MKELFCETCECFRQHYGRTGKRYYKIHCGHCTGVHLKKREPDQKVCERYIPRQGPLPLP